MEGGRDGTLSQSWLDADQVALATAVLAVAEHWKYWVAWCHTARMGYEYWDNPLASMHHTWD